MKHPILLVLALGGSLIAGCNNESPEGASTPPADTAAPTESAAPPAPEPTFADQAGDALAQAAERATETAEQVGESLQQQKDRAIEAAMERLEALRPQVEQLRERGRALGDDARAGFDALMEQIEGQLETVDVRIAALRDAGAEAWKGASAELATALDRLGELLAEAKQRFGGS